MHSAKATSGLSPTASLVLEPPLHPASPFPDPNDRRLSAKIVEVEAVGTTSVFSPYLDHTKDRLTRLRCAIRLTKYRRRGSRNTPHKCSARRVSEPATIWGSFFRSDLVQLMAFRFYDTDGFRTCWKVTDTNRLCKDTRFAKCRTGVTNDPKRKKKKQLKEYAAEARWAQLSQEA